MRLLLLFAFSFCLLNILNAQDTTQQLVTGRKNQAAQMQKPYLILISADGF
ncbi:MAG TPA: alkaline phosphatase family protein, partial [Chitinophagaceae bacterium]|nr:alkaline phosphatase family protein [Chitinophagaceae bacterium]